MALAGSAVLPRSLAVGRVNSRAVVGIVLALAGAALVLWLYRSHQPRTVDVLRVAHDVPAGTVLRTEDLQAVSEALPEDMVATLLPASEGQILVGRTLGQPLNAGDLLTRRQAVPAVQRIPKGQRVYTIPVGAETAAGGQIQAGDDVEVIVTVNKNQPDQARTETIVPRARVYAVGRQAAPSDLFAPASSGTSADGRVAWLALLLDDPQFQVLARARWTGDLDVALLPAASDNR